MSPAGPSPRILRALIRNDEALLQHYEQQLVDDSGKIDFLSPAIQNAAGAHAFQAFGEVGRRIQGRREALRILTPAPAAASHASA